MLAIAIAIAPLSAAAAVPVLPVFAAPEATSLTAEMRTAIAAAETDPNSGRAKLRAALARFDEEPSVVATSNDAHAARIDGLLALAKAELAADREAEDAPADDADRRVSHGPDRLRRRGSAASAAS